MAESASSSWWRQRRRFIWDSFVRGLQPHAAVFGLISLATGATIFGLVGWPWHQHRLGVELTGLWFLVIVLEGAFRLDRDEQRATAMALDRVAELERAPRPRLRFMHTEVADAHVIGGAMAPGRPMPTSGALTAMHPLAVPRAHRFARVQIANDPLPGEAGVRAERVTAVVTFFEWESDEQLVEMHGRWAETPQRLETGRMGLSLEETQLDIDPNGLPHPLDITAKRRLVEGLLLN